MKYHFKQVDVFTDKACLGNPVAVFLESDGLSTNDMQRIAGWTNLSETTFVSKSNIADYKVRIFTPLEELPFAGHPTLGTAWALREAGMLPKDKIVQECAFGLVNIEFKDNKVFFELPKYDVEPLEHEEILSPATGINLKEGKLITTGPRWVIARLENASDLRKIHLDNARFEELLQANKSTGATVYALREKGGVDVRTFFKSFDGFVEDPVCGSGNAAVAAHIMTTGLVAHVGNSYEAFQGEALNRDGRIAVTLGDKIKIGGACVSVISGAAEL